MPSDSDQVAMHCFHLIYDLLPGQFHWSSFFFSLLFAPYHNKFGIFAVESTVQYQP